MTASVLWVALCSAALLAAVVALAPARRPLAPALKLTRAHERPARAGLVWDTWSYSFVLHFTNGSVPIIATGVEYFSAEENVVRRDWVQGAVRAPGCPLEAFAGGTEFHDWTRRSRHVMQLAGGDWTCSQINMEGGSTAPTPDFLSHAHNSNATQPIRGVPCAVWTGQGSNRPGPPTNSSAWTLWVGNGVPMQLQTDDYTLEMWNWASAPASNGGSLTSFSVPLECPIDVPPGWFGYVLSGAFIAVLFFSVATIRRKKDNTAF